MFGKGSGLIGIGRLETLMHVGIQRLTSESGLAHSARTVFPNSVTPEQVVVHPGWAAAWQVALVALNVRPARPGQIVAIVGQPGVGKSLFIQALDAALRPNQPVVLIRPGSPVEVGSPQIVPEIVLVDDADRLPPEVTEALIHRGYRCVLAGSPALLDRFPAGLSDFSVIELRPIAPADVAAFLAVQLARAGQPAHRFTPDAVTVLAHRSGGNPRTLQMLAGLTMFLARLEDAPQVTAEHVTEAAEVQSGTSLPPMDPLFGMPASMPPPRAAAGLTPINPRRSNKPTLVAVAALATLCVATAALVRIGPDAVLPGILASARAITATLNPGVDGTAAQASQPAVAAFDAGQRPASSAAVDPAPPVAARPPRSEPAQAPLSTAVALRIVVVFPRGDAEAARRGADLTRKLRANGYEAEDPIPAALRANDPTVGYFFAEDASGAAAVARDSGETGRERLVPAQGRPPRPGTIRLAIPSSSPTATTVSPANPSGTRGRRANPNFSRPEAT